MPRFIAVHTIPHTSKEKWIEVANKMGPFPKDVTWHRTYCDFKNYKFFCEWDAPSQQRLEQGLKSLFIPLDAVYPTEVWNAVKKEFEGS